MSNVRPHLNSQAYRATLPRQALALVAALSITFLAATAGGIASVNATSFYAQLVKPSWAPPGWVFGPVWLVLYTLMAFAVWLAWRAVGFTQAKVAVLLFLVQLIANALWSWLFFAWRFGALALVDVIALWALLAATLAAFWRIQRLAAILLVPYLAWVTFAAALTRAVWHLNPALLG